MKDTTASSPKWLLRLLSRFRPHRDIAQGTGQNTVAGPISTKAITAAEGALRWIAKVPGGNKVQVRIGGALEVIKALNVVSLSISFSESLAFPTLLPTSSLSFITELPQFCLS
ncbi:hypothetical protein BS47DRAFT_985478 [Hydnum rufescens UP504]|uniref:Uncharacterized protein n=1 Tax=Hydnum rufescens UP504 TaxID=1448309 RepID=A0A9P6AW90_9AGAM|nr:hypothetical protein BS47DRAFT_985478 [Hydnum rufescens UP504]